MATNRHLNNIDAVDASFDEYVATTSDPGNSLFLTAILICIISIVALPLCAYWPPCILCLERIRKYWSKCNSDAMKVDDHTGDVELNKTQSTVLSEQLGIGDDVVCSTIPSPPVCARGDPDFLRVTILHFWTIATFHFWKVAKFDQEMKRISKLSTSFIFSAISRNVSELVILAIISHSLGTDDMIAYAMVGLITGVTSTFLGGWIEAISSLGSMSYGARNYKLTGQYLQVSFIAYTLCEIPVALIWSQCMGKIILLLGFEESVAFIGQNYVWVGLLINIMSNLNKGAIEFLSLVEKEAFANVAYCISCFFGVGLVAPIAIVADASLEEVGLALFFNQALLFALNILISSKMGWLKEFDDGLFSGLSYESLPVVNVVFHVAVPLAFGNLLISAEWEILTILAAILGPAEAATWAVLGYIWDLFESTTEALGDAVELRVAYHLGKGQPDMAKISGYKSMFLAAIVTGSASVILMSLINVLPPLLTYDATIQVMLIELFPLVALGNVAMSMGMVCWAIVGAQGRYRLSTVIATSCAFFITIPIAIVTTTMRVDLQGLTFAVVAGYTVTATLLSLVVLMSDWKFLSEKIIEDMDDSSIYSSSLMKHPVTPPRTIPAMVTPYTPPIKPEEEVFAVLACVPDPASSVSVIKSSSSSLSSPSTSYSKDLAPRTPRINLEEDVFCVVGCVPTSSASAIKSSSSSTLS
jgi:Na+-driven multidrug efflux pump